MKWDFFLASDFRCLGGGARHCESPGLWFVFVLGRGKSLSIHCLGFGGVRGTASIPPDCYDFVVLLPRLGGGKTILRVCPALFITSHRLLFVLLFVS
jgi:hypothetical protein